jgi:hypothetical protein
MTGGFVDKDGVAPTKGGGTLLVGAGNGWVGPGGESVLFSGNRAYLVYHAYAATDGHFALHMSDLFWDVTGGPAGDHVEPLVGGCGVADAAKIEPRQRPGPPAPSSGG